MQRVCRRVAAKATVLRAGGEVAVARASQDANEHRNAAVLGAEDHNHERPQQQKTAMPEGVMASKEKPWGAKVRINQAKSLMRGTGAPGPKGVSRRSRTRSRDAERKTAEDRRAGPSSARDHDAYMDALADFLTDAAATSPPPRSGYAPKEAGSRAGDRHADPGRARGRDALHDAASPRRRSAGGSDRDVAREALEHASVVLQAALDGGAQRAALEEALSCLHAAIRRLQRPT